MAAKHGKLALIAALSFHAAQTYAQGSGQRLLLQTREPTTSWYVYGGADWSRQSEVNPDFHGYALEGRAVLPSDVEFAVRGRWLNVDDASVGGRLSEFGDTTLSVVKSFHNVGKLNYLSFEFGKVLPASEEELRGRVDRYGRIRVQAGPTRAGVEISVTAVELTESDEDDDVRSYTGSVGLRSQWGQLYLGADVSLTTSFEGGPSASADLIAMYRRVNGHSVYGIVERGISGGDDSEYVSIGYEFRF